MREREDRKRVEKRTQNIIKEKTVEGSRYPKVSRERHLVKGEEDEI